MVEISDIKKLRDETGVSIMQCKKAIEESCGDIEKAKVILRKISATVAEKKSDRELGSGTVQAYVHANNSICAVVVLACETDFVAKNEEFIKLAYDIAMHTAALAPQFTSASDVTDEDTAVARGVFEEEAEDKPKEMREKIVEGKMRSYLKEKILLDQPFVKDTEKTVKTLLSEAVQKFGERIEVAEFKRFAV